VLDISVPLGAQDKRIAQLIYNSRKGLVVVANKIDLVKKSDWRKNLTCRIHQFFPFLDWAPVVFVSARTNEKVNNIYDEILRVDENRKKELNAKDLETFIKNLSRQHKPLKAKGVRHPYIFGIKQTGVEPPRFTIFIKEKTSVHESYLKFLSKQIRNKFGLAGTPLVIETKDLKI
jgi:GTP-binding protein